MKNYSRYKFNPDKTVTNAATGDPITVQELTPGGIKFYRLTNDNGERKRVYLKDIVFPAPGTKPAKHTKGKLDMEKAKAIRASLTAGKKVAELATEYGVDKSAIYDIRNGRLYNDGSIVYTGTR